MRRQVSWRVFAHEFNRANLQQSGDEPRAPSFVITPTGAKCNRLFVIGVATEVENIGVDTDLWRARIADPTGVFTTYAGQYQPEVSIMLSKMEVPQFVALTGKARLYEPDDTSTYASMRIEDIGISSSFARDKWILNTGIRSMERVSAMRLAIGSSLKGWKLMNHLLDKGVDENIADGVTRAIDHYPIGSDVLNDIKHIVLGAVRSIVRDELQHEKSRNIVLELMQSMDEGGGVEYDALIEASKEGGLGEVMLEEVVQDLMREGRCSEPKIGILKLV